MSLVLNNVISGNCFLKEVVLTPGDGESAFASEQSLCQQAISECRGRGRPVVKVSGASEGTASSCAATLSIPVFYAGRLASILSFVMAAGAEDDPEKPVGVAEVWTPRGAYNDLRLESGYFGSLTRFQNVSSFVRFERGAGLPGQAWQAERALIHDELANHPGFLRAAGASADELRTAVGIPVFAEQFIASVVLISSAATPIARGIEVWKPAADQFELVDCAYCDLPETQQLEVGSLPAGRDCVLGAVVEARSAVLIQESEATDGPTNAGSVGIPTYLGTELSCITKLVL